MQPMIGGNGISSLLGEGWRYGWYGPENADTLAHLVDSIKRVTPEAKVTRLMSPLGIWGTRVGIHSGITVISSPLDADPEYLIGNGETALRKQSLTFVLRQYKHTDSQNHPVYSLSSYLDGRRLRILRSMTDEELGISKMSKTLKHRGLDYLLNRMKDATKRFAEAHQLPLP